MGLSLREILAKQGIESSSARIDRVNRARVERVVVPKASSADDYEAPLPWSIGIQAT